MFAIRKKLSHKWLSKIDYHYPIQSTRRILLDTDIPILYIHSELARLEMISNHLSSHAYEVVEIEVNVKKSVCL